MLSAQGRWAWPSRAGRRTQPPHPGRSRSPALAGPHCEPGLCLGAQMSHFVWRSVPVNPLGCFRVLPWVWGPHGHRQARKELGDTAALLSGESACLRVVVFLSFFKKNQNICRSFFLYFPCFSHPVTSWVTVPEEALHRCSPASASVRPSQRGAVGEGHSGLPWCPASSWARARHHQPPRAPRTAEGTLWVFLDPHRWTVETLS